METDLDTQPGAHEQVEVGLVSDAIALPAIATPVINARASWMGPRPTPNSGVPASGLCLDVENASTAPETRVQIYYCNNQNNQKWVYEYQGRRIRDANSGLCLDVVGGDAANGAELQIYPCHGGLNQRWDWSADGTFSVRSSSGVRKCLDVPSHATSPTRLQVWDCHADNNQVWTRQSTTLRNYVSGRCLDLMTQDGTTVQLWDCHSGANQKWSMGGIGLHSDFNSSRAVVADMSNKLVTTGSSGVRDFTMRANGTIGLLVSGYSSGQFCLDVDDPLQPNGSRVRVKDCTDSASQVWATVPP